ncbi:hypothetical protein ABG067_003821 [Albugo candida]
MEGGSSSSDSISFVERLLVFSISNNAIDFCFASSSISNSSDGTITSSYNHLLNEAETLFEELYSLCDFYRQFELAYANSLEELYRRQMFDKKTETTIQEMMCLLQRQVDDENSRRVEFNQEHFRYLPATLSPQLSVRSELHWKRKTDQ